MIMMIQEKYHSPVTDVNLMQIYGCEKAVKKKR